MTPPPLCHCGHDLASHIEVAGHHGRVCNVPECTCIRALDANDANLRPCTCGHGELLHLRRARGMGRKCVTVRCVCEEYAEKL